MKIVITGGSGFVGSSLSAFLIEKGHAITAIGRSAQSRLAISRHYEYRSADTTEKGDWQETVNDADAVINLTGKTIFKYWREAYKKQIYDSRILTTRNIVDALPEGKDVRFLSTSAAGYYGDRDQEPLDESSPPGSDFLATIGVAWEKEAYKAETKNARVAAMRFGIVFGKNGGALTRMLPVYKSFLGGPLGNGRQWFPWIHIHDLMAAIDFLLHRKDISGPVNFCAPGAITQKDLSRVLGRCLKRPSLLPVPAFLLRLFMGELGQSLLSSQRVVPRVLLKEGFSFNFPDVNSALMDLIA
jgi:uncharacterized protein (TIGR01777 family)